MVAKTDLYWLLA